MPRARVCVLIYLSDHTFSIDSFVVRTHIFFFISYGHDGGFLTPNKLNKENGILLIVREPAILLIKWLRPKGLKVCSHVEKYAEFKN